MHSQLQWNSRPLCTARSRTAGLVGIWSCAEWGRATRPAGFSPGSCTYQQAHGLSREGAEPLFSPSQNHILRGWQHSWQLELLPAVSGSFLGTLLWGWLSGSLSGTHFVSTGGVGFIGCDAKEVLTCRDQPGWQPSSLPWNVFQSWRERRQLSLYSSNHFCWGASLSGVIPVPGTETTQSFHRCHILSGMVQMVNSVSKILWTWLFREGAWCAADECGP